MNADLETPMRSQSTFCCLHNTQNGRNAALPTADLLRDAYL